MAEYLIQGETLTAIGDAIRAKDGSTAQIAPGDMPAKIAAIETGGGGKAYSYYDDVCFYDYDGTLIYSCTLAEAQAMTALPAAPDHSGDPVPLTFVYWNYTLEEVNGLTRKADIGAIFKATDGKTHFTLELTAISGLTVPLNLSAYNTYPLYVDWGDGSEVEASAATSGTRNMEHTYAQAGTYQVTCWMVDGTWIPGGASSLGLCGKSDKNICIVGTFVLGDDVTFAWPSNVGSSCFDDSRIEYLVYPYSGSWAGGSRFEAMHCLKFLAVKPGSTNYLQRFLNDCFSLEGISLPNDVVAAGDYGFSDLYKIRRICLPESFTATASISQRFMFQNTPLREIRLNEGQTTISMRDFEDVRPLLELTIPSTVTAVASEAFAGSSILDFYFLPTTPPTLSNTNAFSDNAWGTQYKIHVPAESLEAYQTATNWSTFADRMVGDIT